MLLNGLLSNRGARVRYSLPRRLLLAYVFLTAVITLLYCIAYMFSIVHFPMTVHRVAWKQSVMICKEGFVVNDNLTQAAINTSRKTLDEIEYIYGPTLQPGGIFVPPNCTSTSRIAILVPYRDRIEHLRVFLNHMHHFLQKQNIMYGIYVIEMDRGSKFNRALLLNVGFVKAIKEQNFTCIVLHDVDLLPEDYRIPYTCPHQPTHLSVSTSRFEYRLPYYKYFGGVSVISVEHYKQINGMSNIFFGWGGEDDELYSRIRHHNLTVSRPPAYIARYKMLEHKADKDVNPVSNCLLTSTAERYAMDGLNSLKYTLRGKEQRVLYTWLLIGVNSTEIIEENYILQSFYKTCLKKYNDKYLLAFEIV